MSSKLLNCCFWAWQICSFSCLQDECCSAQSELVWQHSERQQGRFACASRVSPVCLSAQQRFSWRPAGPALHPAVALIYQMLARISSEVPGVPACCRPGPAQQLIPTLGCSRPQEATPTMTRSLMHLCPCLHDLFRSFFLCLISTNSLAHSSPSPTTPTDTETQRAAGLTSTCACIS